MEGADDCRDIRSILFVGRERSSVLVQRGRQTAEDESPCLLYETTARRELSARQMRAKPFEKCHVVEDLECIRASLGPERIELPIGMSSVTAGGIDKGSRSVEPAHGIKSNSIVGQFGCRLYQPISSLVGPGYVGGRNDRKRANGSLCRPDH